MSPAAIAEMQPDLHNEQLDAVGKAFDALLLTVFRLTHRQNELFQHMDNVFKEVRTTPFSLSLPPRVAFASGSRMMMKSSRSGATFLWQ